MQWLELLTHYNYEIHYHPSDKNSAADALSRCAELRLPDGEDDKLASLIPSEKFTELATCEADLMQEDWECDKTRDEPSRVTDRGHGEWS